ncbi:ion channel [Bacillus toyonensis]|uniref:ion channel n=1 Tax=Bacillus toyonensis TaxID=155322 RepID=UPI000BEDB401|nr:ion channel [Bacillus toyonensis]PDY52285.1 hypothetical protein CON61_15865 [Bacillus toyonensis]
MIFKKKKKSKINFGIATKPTPRLPLSNGYKGKTFDEYVEYETKDKSKLASLAYSWQDEFHDDDVQDFEFRVDYFWNCVENLKEVPQDIHNLWEKLFLHFDKFKYDSTLKLYLGMLAALTAEAGFSERVKSQLDNKLTDLYYRKFNKELAKDGLNTVLNNITDWFIFKAESYYNDLKLGFAERELRYLQELYEKFEADFEKLKTELPRSFLKYFHCVSCYYENQPETTDYNYDAFYQHTLLGAIVVSKNTGNFTQASNLIYQYHKAIKQQTQGKIKRFGLNVLDYCTGFGEKPYRLIFIYLIMQFIFLAINFPYKFSPLEFKGLESNESFFSKLVATVYLNSSTMLTSVYGDISPLNELARLVIVIEQLLGFIVFASLVTLVLRKLFRF